MFSALRNRVLLPFAALALAASLGGCVAYPAYPDYGGGYYSSGYYGAPSYSGAVVAFDGGGGYHRGGYHHRGWRHRHWHGRGW
jgi:hypothetical protein